MAEQVPSAQSFALPVNVVGRADVARLIRELKAVEDFLKSSEIREAGKQPKMPRTSRLMDELFQLNKMNGLVDADRTSLMRLLEELRTHAPVVHMSFSSDPSPLFLQKLVAWLRQEIDPGVLISVGLQPGLGAGCTVRTTNHYYDFGLRNRFKEKREVLLNKLKALEPTEEGAP